MILCICNNIREQDVKSQPELAKLIGSCCGRCIEEVKVKVAKDSEQHQ
jgi:bacterioferritin-associated ferredoxin